MNLENIKSTTTWAEASGTMNNNNAKITEAIERLESAMEEGGGGGTADSVAWNKVTGKPSWITDSKPVYAKEDLSQGVQTSLDKADTALQAIPDGYATEEYTQTQVRHILTLISTALEGKVDKVDGKQLSTEDFTTALKEKLEAISSSGGGVDSEALKALSDRLDLIVSGGASGVIDSFIDVISFLTGINDSVKLKDMLDTLRESVLKKQNAIEDLDAIRSGASLGATAVQRDALSGYLELGGGQRINAGEDLDNYIQLGTYHCIDNSIAVQLINSPTNQAFTMQVYAPTGNAEYYIGQKIENWGSSIQYKRIKGLKGGTWGNWMVFTPDFANYKAPSAVSADSTSILKGIVTTDFSGSDLIQELKLFTSIPYGSEGLFPCGDNANAVLILNRHTGNYNSQFGFNSRGEVYYRSGNTQVLTTQPWKQLAFTDTKVDASAKTDKIETTEWIVGSHSSAPFVIRSLTYGGNVITCNHEGKVGVGTTNLTHTLTVNGTASISGNTTLGGNVSVSGTALISGHSLRCRVLRDGANQWIIGKIDDENGTIGIGSVNLGQPIKMENLNGNAELKSNGEFSISKNLSVGGNATVSGTLTLRDVRMSDAIAIRMGVGTTISEDYALSVGGDVSVSGYVMTEGVSMYSQRSLKDVVDEEGLSLEELATIKPTRFTWKDGRDERVHIGGIADDVQKVLPEAVRETPEGILTMDYPVASFAVASSLVKPVTDHEERIAELERENKQLREELEMIKRYIGYGNDK